MAFCGTAAFGDPDNPVYRGMLPRYENMMFYNYQDVCCEKGHKTPKAAANHLAKLLAACWDVEPFIGG